VPKALLSKPVRPLLSRPVTPLHDNAPGKGVGVTLGPTKAYLIVGSSPGTTIASITGLRAGEEIDTVSPADGRFEVDVSRRSLIVGASAIAAGSVAVAIITNMGALLNMTVEAMAVPIAPAEDQPVVTSGGGAASFPTQTQHTYKRIGDNTTNVDIDGDPKFRYPGVPAGVLVPAAVNSRFSASLIPGGVSQQRRWNIQVEFDTSSKYVAMIWTQADAAPRLLVTVNGRWVTADPFSITATAGSSSNMLLEFPDNRPRRIKLVVSGSAQMARIETEAAYPPVRPTGKNSLIAIDGDSLSGGAGTPPGGATQFDVWPLAVAAMLGYDHCCNASIGSTKWAPRSDGTADENTSHFGGGRLPLALGLSPDAIVFAGSRNDNSGDAVAITSAVRQALQDSVAVPKRFVMGTFSSFPAQNSAVQAGAAAEGVPFIDMTDGLRPEDLGGDSVHPTYAGAVALRNRIAPRLAAAGCVPAI